MVLIFSSYWRIIDLEDDDLLIRHFVHRTNLYLPFLSDEASRCCHYW